MRPATARLWSPLDENKGQRQRGSRGLRRELESDEASFRKPPTGYPRSTIDSRNIKQHIYSSHTAAER
jgi:hypothetical protein